MKIKKNVPLRKHTSFGIGGQAQYFVEARNKKQVIEAVKWAKENKLPFFILGQGSNLLVSDKDCGGLVVKYGTPLAFYVSQGVAWAAGIPGTIQGAVYGNASAFGKSMKDSVKSVEVLDTKAGKTRIFKNKDCRFGYKKSIFQKKKHLIILSVKIKTKKSDPDKIKKYFSYKKKTQPMEYPSAGSIFKNPQHHYAGRLIEQCGLKGKRIGGAKISEKHANFIVNLGGAKAVDVVKLIKLAKKAVKKKFKIVLQEEIQFLGKF